MKVRLDRRNRIPHVRGWVVAVTVAWLSLIAGLAAAPRLGLGGSDGGVARVVCHVRTITGVPCATCGSTRAGLHLLERRPMAALAQNPLVVIAGSGVALILGLRLITGHQVLLVCAPWEKFVLGGLGLAAFAANWAYVIHLHSNPVS